MSKREPCYSCHKLVHPHRSQYCGECFHTWSKLGLVWHDWKESVAMWHRWRKREFGRSSFPLPRRPGQIFVCPCCVHDL